MGRDRFMRRLVVSAITIVPRGTFVMVDTQCSCGCEGFGAFVMRAQCEKQTQVLPLQRTWLVKEMWSGDALGSAFDRVASGARGVNRVACARKPALQTRSLFAPERCFLRGCFEDFAQVLGQVGGGCSGAPGTARRWRALNGKVFRAAKENIDAGTFVLLGFGRTEAGPSLRSSYGPAISSVRFGQEIVRKVEFGIRENFYS